MKFGFEIAWTTFNGSKQKVVVSECDTALEAVANATKAAVNAGWTQPKVWQWWRLDDTRVSIHTFVAASGNAN